MAKESIFFYLEDFPEFGIINALDISRIKPSHYYDSDRDKHEYSIYVHYLSKNYDKFVFDNKIARDAVLKRLQFEIATFYVSSSELRLAIEEITQASCKNDAIGSIEKKKDVKDPTDLNSFKEVKV